MTPGSPRRRRAKGPLVILVSSLAGLVVMVGVFIAVSEADRGSGTAVAQAEASAAAPAAVAPAVSAPAVSAPLQPVAPAAPAGVSEAPAAQEPAAQRQAPAARSETRVPAAAQPKPAVKAAVAPAGSSPVDASSASVSDGSGTALPSTPGERFDITKRTEWPPTTNRKAYVSWMLAHLGESEKFLNAKWDRAQTILAIGNITHKRVLEAFLMTPREEFSRDPKRAYDNAALPIGWGQTISGPHMVSRMTDYLDPQPDQKVLEIGTGSGYQSAVLSELSNHVYTIEIVDPLARKTNSIYQSLEPRYPEYRNIERKVDDGYYGWPQYAPFDRIIVTCGIDHVPPELLRELAPEGIMVIPVGPPSGQTILRIIKHVGPDGSVSLDREDIYQGKRKQIFVPFTAKGGGVHSTADGANP